MMQAQRYTHLNPLAMAVASGCTELLLVLISGARAMSLMRGYGHMGWVGPVFPFAFRFVWWVGGALLTALGGAVFAWIYNAVNGRAAVAETAQPTTPSTPSTAAPSTPPQGS
jgi:hypothetical protein